MYDRELAFVLKLFPFPGYKCGKLTASNTNTP